MAQATERSPLLAPLHRPPPVPRTATTTAAAHDNNNAMTRHGVSELGEPQQASFLGGSQTIRHRKKSRSQPTRLTTDEDDDSGDERDNDRYSNDDGESESGSTDGAGAGTDIAEQTKRAVADRRFQRGRSPPSSSATIDFGLLPQGLTKRKPRWSGLRNKLTAISSGKTHDVLPRVSGRRNRHRPTNLRGDGDNADGLYYYDAVVLDRSLRAPPTDTPKARIAAYCTCDQIALFKLLKWLDRPGKEASAAASGVATTGVVGAGVTGTAASGAASRSHLTGWTNKMYMGVVHSTLRAASDDTNGNDNGREPLDALAQRRRPLQQKDAFYFATGCCVFWGLTREEEAVHLQALAPFSTGPVAQIEAEDMLFCYGETSRVANDEITLGSTAVAEKLAISFAMSQSAKLDVFEERVEDRIKNTKHIPSNLATTGSTQYTKTDISRLIGQLFIELADVNLHSEILDEPDFFWEDDTYEPLYARMVKYLDVNSRVKILNKRLDILRELVEVLNQELTRQHGTKLEWIIIWLLAAEIVISVVWNITMKDLLGYFRH